VSRGTLDPDHRMQPFAYEAITRYGLPFQVIQLDHFRIISVHNPGQASLIGLGKSPFARRYLGNLF
jgi:hypothetical protein